MFADSVPQSYSRHFLWAVYNAHAVRAICICPGKFNIDRFYKAKPANAGEAKLRVKAASYCHLQGYQEYSVKVPRLSGSFDF
jgi:hypothetical protein